MCVHVCGGMEGWRGEARKAAETREKERKDEEEEKTGRLRR